MASIITNNSLLLFGLKLFWLFLLSFQITNMCYRPSPVAQQVENLPAMQETQRVLTTGQPGKSPANIFNSFIFCKRSGSKYFRLCEPHVVRHIFFFF